MIIRNCRVHTHMVIGQRQNNVYMIEELCFKEHGQSPKGLVNSGYIKSI